MNTLKNSVTLVGNVGKEIELINLENDKKLVKFSLAVNENYKTQSGGTETKTEWFNLVAWGKTAELVSNIVKKGNEIIVKGKLKNNVYEVDGNKRYSMDIVVSEFYNTTKKPD